MNKVKGILTNRKEGKKCKKYATSKEWKIPEDNILYKAVSGKRRVPHRDKNYIRSIAGISTKISNMVNLD